MASDDDSIRTLRSLLHESRSVVGFTGAGISTESGIPDYRGTGGVWTRYQPVYFQEFLRDPAKRLAYWRRTLEMWPAIRDARPNAGHEFFADLFRAGKLRGLITQNIDGLHEKSGLPGELIVNLHGSALEVVCLSCSRRFPSEQIASSADLARGVPLCPSCRGLVKPDTISFGQPLRPEDLARAEELAGGCDLMVAMGSTLTVHPAAGIPVIAKRSGASLAIATLSETPLDELADVVIRMGIGELVKRLDYESGAHEP